MTQGRLFGYGAESPPKEYSRFVVDLPHAGASFLSRIPGYSKLKKTGISTGANEAHALGRFVARQNVRYVGLIVDALRTCDGGIERSVIRVPEVATENGFPVSVADSHFGTFQAMALAEEFAAERGGSPESYYRKARCLLTQRYRELG